MPVQSTKTRFQLTPTQDPKHTHEQEKQAYCIRVGREGGGKAADGDMY